MAEDALIIRTSIRSTSMPPRSHPINLQLEEIKLNRLEGWEALPSTSYAPSMEMLRGLRNLYQSLEILLRSQRSQQALARDSNSVEQELDGSLRLLDAISATRDDMLQMTQLISDIQSAIRRRWVSKSELEEGDCETRQGPVTTSKWSLVSKYWMGTALVTSEEETADQRMSETARVEASLNALICRQKTGKEEEGIRAHDVQKQLETLERSLRVIEEELQGMFRRLIRIRVCLLNSLSC
ncbi:hypothetical protein H6P81_019004 [Aristolochia fimbriata]|uniref:Uncharacterized protein n=1 Tax=Aristolochia fimbriata TaxID=158543 RepID=A0AAV7E2M1_ARIFI|nr:hypothetical protein H6P81_019004 [Aristolochia fimbriata]